MRRIRWLRCPVRSCTRARYFIHIFTRPAVPYRVHKPIRLSSPRCVEYNSFAQPACYWILAEHVRSANALFSAKDKSEGSDQHSPEAEPFGAGGSKAIDDASTAGNGPLNME